MSRRDLGWLLIAAGLILLAGQLVTDQGSAVLAALAIGAALWKVFASDYRDRHWGREHTARLGLLRRAILGTKED